MKAAHFLILAFLVLPGLAVHRAFGPGVLAWAGGWVLFISSVTWYLYARDKRLARVNLWRTSEATLHLAELLGGWPGAFLAQRKLRHKSSKGSYQFIFILIIGTHQFLALESFWGWPVSRQLLAAIGDLN